MALNTYLIICLVLVQPDFKIKEVFEYHYNCVGGVPLKVNVWVILGSH